MHDFLLALLGGIFIGSATVGYLYLHGKIAGISGLLAQAMHPNTRFKTPAIWFLLGIIVPPFFYQLITQPNIQPHIQISSSPLWLIIAGLLVGFGTRLGSGCTSGHGICGISRLSKRSIIATLTFMLTGIITVYLARHVFGGI